MSKDYNVSIVPLNESLEVFEKYKSGMLGNRIILSMIKDLVDDSKLVIAEKDGEVVGVSAFAFYSEGHKSVVGSDSLFGCEGFNREPLFRNVCKSLYSRNTECHFNNNWVSDAGDYYKVHFGDGLVSNLFSNDDELKLGLGSDMLAAVEGELKDTGANRILADCSLSDYGLKRVFGSCGYGDVLSVKNFTFEDFGSDLLFSKRLN